MDLNRIESMTILKDAASTAIYGAKAANGVVVVETVKPKAGKLRFSYNGSANISEPDLSSYNLMNAAEKLEFEYLAGKYTTNSGNWSPENEILFNNAYNERLAQVASGVDTYWLSVPLRTGLNQKHHVYEKRKQKILSWGGDAHISACNKWVQHILWIGGLAGLLYNIFSIRPQIQCDSPGFVSYDRPFSCFADMRIQSDSQ